MKKTTSQQKRRKASESKSDSPQITGQLLPTLRLQTSDGHDVYVNRSRLDGLTKLEVVECLLETNPGFGFRQIYDMILRKKIGAVCDKKDKASQKKHNRLMRQFMRFKTLTAHAEKKGSDLLTTMMRFPKLWLVELSYTLSDRRLNHWYDSPTASHTINLDRDDPRLDYRKTRAYVLKEERPIQVESSFWSQQWEKRKKRGIKLRFRSRKRVTVHKAANDSVPVTKIASNGAKLKRRTLAWVDALRSHNRYMREDCKVNLASDFGR